MCGINTDAKISQNYYCNIGLRDYKDNTRRNKIKGINKLLKLEYIKFAKL